VSLLQLKTVVLVVRELHHPLRVHLSLMVAVVVRVQVTVVQVAQVAQVAVVQEEQTHLQVVLVEQRTLVVVAVVTEVQVQAQVLVVLALLLLDTQSDKRKKYGTFCRNRFKQQSPTSNRCSRRTRNQRRRVVQQPSWWHMGSNQLQQPYSQTVCRYRLHL
jgi:hypothetical protein